MLSPKLSFSLSAALRKAAEKGANSASCHERHQRRQRVVGQQTGSELWTSISLLCTRCPPRQPPSASSTLHGMQILKEKKQNPHRALPLPSARSEGRPEMRCPDTHFTSNRTAKRSCVTTFPFCSQLSTTPSFLPLALPNTEPMLSQHPPLPQSCF